MEQGKRSLQTWHSINLTPETWFNMNTLFPCEKILIIKVPWSSDHLLYIPATFILSSLLLYPLPAKPGMGVTKALFANFSVTGNFD